MINGTIPKTVIKISKSKSLSNDLSVLGAGVSKKYFNTEAYYTQAVFIGACLDPQIKTIIAIMPTRYGKSYSLAIPALMFASIDDKEVSIVASDSNKSTIILNKISDHLKNADGVITNGLIAKSEALDKLTQQISKSGLGWQKGGSIKPYSVNEHLKNKTIRGSGFIGIGGDVILIDEACLISDENLSVIMRSRIEKPDTKLIMITNPHQKNLVSRLYDDPETFVIHINDQTAIEEGRFTQKDLDEASKGMTQRDINVYFKCLWQDDLGEDTFFEGLTIPDKQITDKPKAIVKYAGLDCAWRGRDDIRYTELEVIGQELYITKSISFKPDKWDSGTAKEVSQLIINQLKISNISAMGIDVGGNGALLYEYIREIGTDTYVYDINFGSRPTDELVEKSKPLSVNALNRRAEMYLYTKYHLENNQLFNTTNQDYNEEVKATTYKMNKGKYQLESKEIISQRLGKSPDKLDSLVLAVMARTMFNEASSYVSTGLLGANIGV